MQTKRPFGARYSPSSSPTPSVISEPMHGYLETCSMRTMPLPFSRSTTRILRDTASRFIPRPNGSGMSFRRALAKKGRDRDRVVFTAGGNAVGKSLAISFSGASNHSTAAVFDSTFSDPAHSVRLVGQAAGAGKRVAILFVYRPVAETLMAMLDRAGAEGRVVTLDQLIRSRRGAAETVRMLWDRFGNRSDFAFHFFDNSPGGFKESGVELTKPGAYTEERESLDGILDAEHRSTRISEAVYRRVKGRRESPLCGD